MHKLRILLLEDLELESIKVTNLLEEHNYEVLVAKDIFEAEEKIKNYFFDVILLDIMINGKPEGITLANSINKQGLNIPFLFLTSMQSKAVFDEAKLTKPFTYLLKPYNTLELLYSLELAIETFHEQSNTLSTGEDKAVISPSFLFLKKKRRIMKVEITSISYIEVKEKYCSLICNEGSFLIKQSLTKLKQMLSNPNFVQTHRNFLINITKIKEIYFEDNLIILQDKSQIPFSERYKNQFIKNNTILR